MWQSQCPLATVCSWCSNSMEGRWKCHNEIHPLWHWKFDHPFRMTPFKEWWKAHHTCNSSNMESCIYRRWTVCDSVSFLSHTFFAGVSSLRTVDLTRNVTAGEGTGQVNIESWRKHHGRLELRQDYRHIINTEHHKIQYVTHQWDAHRHNVGTPECWDTHYTTNRRSVRDNVIQQVSNEMLQRHGNSCAVQLVIRFNT